MKIRHEKSLEKSIVGEQERYLEFAVKMLHLHIIYIYNATSTYLH